MQDRENEPGFICYQTRSPKWGPYRFHNPAEEPELNRDIVPYLDDNVQLSIEEYRDKLYEVHVL
jgi:hypothetical protein